MLARGIDGIGLDIFATASPEIANTEKVSMMFT
jgi:hypothetical protein